jgi:hypothetical protein
VTEFDLQPTVGYRLNPRKLKTAPQGILPFVVGAFYYTEDYEYFDIIKPYLDIPEPRKSLEEIQQELDDKFEELWVKTKRKFFVSKESADHKFKQFCDKQDAYFEYARENERFPLKLSATGVTSGSYLISESCGADWANGFVIEQGTKHEGYYTFGNRRCFKYYMPDKPSVVVRFFMKNCLGLFWVDEK